MEKIGSAKKIVIAIGVGLLSAIIALSVALGVIEHKRRSANAQLNNLYEKSYSETMTSLETISTKLSKVSVLEGTKLRQQLLNDVWRECGIASSNLAQMSEGSENLNEAIRMLNQIGDYCQYLGRKISTTQLTETESGHLDTFGEAVSQLNTALAEVQNDLIRGGKVDSSVLTNLSSVTEKIGNIDYSSIDYPELIYDGPFSDGLDDRETKFLNGKDEISVERGIELIAQYFEGSSDIVKQGETKDPIPSYIYGFKYNDREGSAYISKAGGYVVQFDSYCEVTEPNLTDSQCVEKAKVYMEKLGYSNMEPVWVSNNNSTVYINFAYTENDIVYYPDLIKIKVCSDTGHMVGVEAINYIYNHVERDLEVPKSIDHISIPASLSVSSKRFCLIPTEWHTEILCYEVVAKKNDNTYYIYYEAKSGEEEKVMLVIDEDGQLLI
ncbi:MAG: hypothetical protein GX242_02155 [Clostridiales bacterium]|mgnify:CR=1 FL=1|nr:hypothetical protein [Clostridiales bacterium]